MANLSDNTVGKITTLATLVLGIAIGFVIGAIYHPRESVRAQAVEPPVQTFQDVTPVLTVPSVGAQLILAHDISADEVVVNGYNLLKLEQGVINYLASRPLAENADFQNIINASRATTIYRFKPQAPPTQVLPQQTPQTPGRHQ